ncbi:aminopeptidase P family protein [Radicibacter daui]|uniref:aminopeptidase P family protein n=1 Tax=Radicibacter daui TaxID=3064829 RepID=UPI004046C390
MTDTIRIRLSRLRALMASGGLAAFLVPKADEHQGEYVPARAERLEWISGFTGSAGVAAILMDRAALFVDGRYTLQAGQQVDAADWEIHHLVEEPAARWLATTLPAGAKVGFDPWLFTVSQVDWMTAELARAGVSAVPVAENLIDLIWEDQPAPPMAAIVPQLIEYAGQEAADKCAAIGGALGADGIHAALLTQPDAIAWLLNVRGADVPNTPLPLSFAVLHADGRVDWFVAEGKLTPAVKATLGNRVSVRAPDALGAVLDDLGTQALKVRIDPSNTALWLAERLKAAGATLERGMDPISLPKACKNAAELAGCRAAHRRDGAAMARFLHWLEETAAGGGLDEMTVVDRLYAFRAEDPLFRGNSFDSISGSGPNGAIVHYRVSAESNRMLGLGELFLIDSGAQYQDGTTDITRTVAIGVPTEEMRAHFTAVLRGHIALSRARFPAGTVGGQLDAFARQFLWQQGLDYDHGTGHGVGSYLSVHEGPARISKAASTVALQPGMILSNEPGYYRTGRYGIRIENLVAVEECQALVGAERRFFSFETLTLAPISRELILVEILLPEERAWINAYHARVWNEISPLIDEGPVLEWLKAATAVIKLS